jgi:hypothetical protein
MSAMLALSCGMSLRRISSVFCLLTQAGSRDRCRTGSQGEVAGAERSRARFIGQTALAIGCACIACGLTLIAAVGRRDREYPQPVDARQEVGQSAVSSLRPWPTVFFPDASGGRAIPKEDLDRILRKVEPPPSGMPASLCLHALVALGLESKSEGGRFASGRDILRLFTDEESGRGYFGTPLMIGTRYGLRPVVVPTSETIHEKHYDQTLGCLAQLDLPLTLPIRADGKTLALGDVLRDSIACFELPQSEIEWTAIAYASYLPPHRAWVNKFGERYTFDQLADELLRRDLTKASCCGCHIFEAVVTLLRADREVALVLSSGIRRRLDRRMREFVSAALSKQEADGSWGPLWYRELLPAPAARELTVRDDRRTESRLLSTSHLAHILMCLPERSQSTRAALLKSEAWIYRVLKDATPEFIHRNYCPSSHGAWVLRTASNAAAASPATPTGRPQRRSRPDSSEEP